jgi:CheY-like chemotaxis protein/MinD-like ATPase involved in chromosome partitioning or flagellar assembly
MAAKVLLVDDDIDTLRLVGLMLQHQGYQIAAASSGEQGIAKARSEQPDVILLDVMMPEMDGFEVARRLRKDPLTQSTPILMFTARSQLDDKVAAFEAGADDYLTKPTNPEELQAHVRQLLERAREREASAAASARRGHAVAILAAQGGLGVSTLATNLAASLQAGSKAEVILAELAPGQGTLARDLDVPSPRAVGDLLTGPAEQITIERVRAALVRHSSGLRLLLASDNARHGSLPGQTEQFVALFEGLAALAAYIVLDLGSALSPWTERILPLCKDWMVVTEASPNTITLTRHLIDQLTDLGIEPAMITVVLNTRDRHKTQLPWAMAQQRLGHPILADLRPAPELMAAAARRHLPAVVATPEDVTSQQITRLADSIRVRGNAG